METGRSVSEQQGNLDLYSFFLFFCFFSIFSPMCHSDLDYSILSISTAQTDTWQRSIFISHRQVVPLNMTHIQSALVHPNCMCLKSNRKKSGLLSLSKKRGSLLFGKKVWCGKRCFKGYIWKTPVSAAQEPPSSSIKAVNNMLWGKRKEGTPLTIPLSGIQRASW